MRLLLIAVCFILTACASTSKSDNYIRSTGVGNTYEEAKNNAFKEAIEYHLGVAIASERESHNENLTKNQILAYSSGYVDEYKIISQQQIGNKVHVVLDVKLSLLRLGDRIMSKGKDSKNLDGPKHDSQYKSFLENKQNGDRILDSVLNDYPKRAFDIKQNEYTIKIDSNRNLILIVPYVMKWNANYIKAFDDTIKLLSDGTLNLLEEFVLGNAKRNRTNFNGSAYLDWSGSVNLGKGIYYFKDSVIPKKLVQGLEKPMINMEIKDNRNQLLYSKCFKHGENKYYKFDYAFGSTDLEIYQRSSEHTHISLDIHQNSSLARMMKNLFTIELSVIPKKLCPPTE